MSRTQKGSQYERDISRKLSLWWSQGAADDWFWRTDTSGGRATTRAKSGLATANAVGDLSSRTEEGALLLREYVIEIKRGYNDIEILPLLDKDNNKSNHFVVWWKKLTGEAQATQRKPLLIFRRDRAQACIVINHNLYTWFKAFNGPYPTQRIIFPCEDDILYLFRLEHFLTSINPNTLKQQLLRMYGEHKI